MVLLLLIQNIRCYGTAISLLSNDYIKLNFLTDTVPPTIVGAPTGVNDTVTFPDVFDLSITKLEYIGTVVVSDAPVASLIAGLPFTLPFTLTHTPPADCGQMRHDFFISISNNAFY